MHNAIRFYFSQQVALQPDKIHSPLCNSLLTLGIQWGKLHSMYQMYLGIILMPYPCQSMLLPVMITWL